MATRAATKTATRTSAKTTAKTRAKADTKADIKTGTNAGAKTGPKPQPKTAAKAASKTPAKSPAASTPQPHSTNAGAATKAPAVSLVKEVPAASVGTELKKKELLDLVVARSDVKKKFAKPVVEAMLDILGGAIAEERALNLQPMGRVMPKRTKDAGKNRVVIARIRQSKERVEEAAATGAKHQAVAKAAE